MKSIKVLIAIIALFSLAIIGCGNKQPTPLEEKNIEALKKVSVDDLVVCINIDQIRTGDIRDVFIVRNNIKEKSELFVYMIDQFIINLIHIPYYYFKTCRIENWGNSNVNPELIGQIILDGIHRAQGAQSAKPDEK